MQRIGDLLGNCGHFNLIFYNKCKVNVYLCKRLLISVTTKTGVSALSNIISDFVFVHGDLCVFTWI